MMECEGQSTCTSQRLPVGVVAFLLLLVEIEQHFLCKCHEAEGSVQVLSPIRRPLHQLLAPAD